MLKLKWHKLDDKMKAQIKSIRPLNLLLGGIEITPRRFEHLITELSKDSATVFIGCLLDEWIPNLENSIQFKPMSYDAILKLISEVEEKGLIAKNKVAILEYEFKDSKYLIRELSPNRILRINGSNAFVLHYQNYFWEAYDLGVKIESVSPYFDEAEAKDLSQKVYEKSKQGIEEEITHFNKSITDLISDEEYGKKICGILNKVSALSWDWTGRTGALLVKDRQIISWGENRVLQYPGLMLHEGSIRERLKVPIGENMEYYETVHAEPECILKAFGKIDNLQDAILYTTKFVCPMCSKTVAASGIKKIVYMDDYTNAAGYRLMENCGIAVERFQNK